MQINSLGKATQVDYGGKEEGCRGGGFVMDLASGLSLVCFVPCFICE
jgi:hypothetical protein